MHYPIPYPYTNGLNTLLEGYTLITLKVVLTKGSTKVHAQDEDAQVGVGGMAIWCS